MKKMKIAVTGGIGSGKSLVSSLLRKRDYSIIQADNIAKDILNTDEKVKSNMIKAFGSESYNEKGLNVEYLSEKVFSNPANVEKINSIVHPPTISKINSLMEDELKNSDIVFTEAALIFEANMDELFDYVVNVAAPIEIRIKRVTERDSVEPEEVKRRMDNQISDEERKRLADFTINNEGSEEELDSKLDFLLTIIKSVAANS